MTACGHSRGLRSTGTPASTSRRPPGVVCGAHPPRPAATAGPGRRRAPPVRLLWPGPAVAGAGAGRGEADGSGIVEIVQRHPDLAGNGLGPVLLTEALRSLAQRELRPVRLTAAVENRRALALYERFGFVVTDVLPVHGVATPG